MKAKEFVQVHFKNTSVEQAEILIAILGNTGYTGFEETGNDLKAFIDSELFDQQELEAVLKTVAVDSEVSTVKEQNWNAEWEGSFEPVIINDFAAIRAGFHPPVHPVRHEIIITPKMSFGTGHHATTWMMIGQMADMDLANRSVVDFGTGTAVLAILAEKMGAVSVDAIDNDDWSIENAKENIAANNCSGIHISKAGSLEEGKVYDIILANINLNVIVDNLPFLVKAAGKGSEILLSGFLKQDEADLLQLVSVFKLIHVNTLQKGDWICLKLIMD